MAKIDVVGPGRIGCGEHHMHLTADHGGRNERLSSFTDGLSFVRRVDAADGFQWVPKTFVGSGIGNVIG